jgi:hypothetical protein
MRGAPSVVTTLLSCVLASSAPSTQCGAGVETDSAAQSTMLLQLKEVKTAGSAKEGASKTAAQISQRQLLEYAKLKQSLSKTEETAEIMKSMDAALDGSMDAADTTVSKAAARSTVRHPRAHDMSLLQAGNTRRQGTADTLGIAEAVSHVAEEEEDLVSEDAEGQSAADDVDLAEVASKIKKVKGKGKKISLMAVMDILEADRAALNEDGYASIASQRSNRKMERFVRRIATDLGLVITDEGGLKGLVPYYSGQTDTQSFSALQLELLTAAEQPDSWIKEKEKHEDNLSETDVADTKAGAQPVSLLGQASTIVHKARHKVPDLAMALLGSRTIFIIIVGALILALFCLDEGKRTAQHGFEDPLNLSPEPPVVKASSQPT